MSKNINTIVNGIEFKSYVRNNKTFYSVKENDKTTRYEEAEVEEFNKRLAEAQAAEKAGENKTERRAKGERYADAEQAKEVILAKLPAKYTVKTGSRGRILYMQDKAKLVSIHACKTHYTVYISKHLLATPDQVKAALKDTFKIEAKVNPTFTTNKGHDPYSVKATVTGATNKDLNKMVDLLIAKNNEVVTA